MGTIDWNPGRPPSSPGSTPVPLEQLATTGTVEAIYKEIGPGRRVALSKLAVEKFEETGRPLRIAIDTSIWLFQIQASKGGTNPALRTFYYRLLRLIALSIHPVFVFDGPNKPPFKRNKRTGPNVASIPEFLAKQLLKQFGYPIHLAPGEAEAECALLQREGIVDAVLSEDVDTLMFGSGLTIRNWSPEKSGKTPTHVNVYDAVETKNGPSGLDREGMILVALMSGGDYVPEGIPGCGPKTACEAAKAGFGRDLCSVPRNDPVALSQWRDRLQHELKTNESKLFKRKHGALKIPSDFPRLDILGYYTHPAISTRAGLDKLRRSINWDQELDYPGLREFTSDAFDWAKLEGAKHFVRSLAPSLLIRALRMRAAQIERMPINNIQAVQEDEALLVKGIHGKRQHAVTDSCTELRVSFIPIELVKINLDDEDPDDEFELPPPSQQAAGDDDDLPLDLEDDAEEGPKKRGPTKFDPTKPARVWVMETFVKVGVPLKVEDWEAERQAKLKPRRAASQEPGKTASKPKNTTTRSKAAHEGTQVGIQGFAKVTKPWSRSSRTLAKSIDSDNAPPPTRPQATLVDLLSSSPVRQQSAHPAVSTLREKSLSPVLEDLPASVTKRRRRAPIQRSKTLPADLSAETERPGIPPLLDTIETLDLVDSPARPSPSPARTKRTRMQTSRANRGVSVTVSPGQGKQTTLDTWRASQTPTKLRDTTSIFDDAPIPTPSQLRRSSDLVDTLDLTLSSPLKTLPSAPTTRTRPPLSSISSNASVSSSSSGSSRGETSKTKPITCTRRTSPRLSRTKVPTPTVDSLDLTTDQPQAAKIVAKPRAQTTGAKAFAVDSLDLTSPQLHPTASPSPKPDTLDLTLSSPAPPPQHAPTPATAASPSLRHSPRAHTSLSPDPDPQSRSQRKPLSPPAAWKAKEKKKRQIILRKSLVGAWTYVDSESPVKAEGGEILKGRERRRWRESEVEVLDLS
ncbi:Flap structure-specific endonuclease [Stagonosporopsis vannaccii]|nr:Flap structure-specific endonuclease [Stagonosporopsis vannaccii]